MKFFYQQKKVLEKLQNYKKGHQNKLKDILFFTNNINKINEIKNLTREYKINIYSQKDYRIEEEPKENGKSFAENAKIKSDFGYKLTKMPFH